MTKTGMIWGFFIAVALAPLPAFAQLGEVPMPQIAPQKETGPTLEETQQWLKEKVAEFGKHVDGNPKQTLAISFKGCELDFLDTRNSGKSDELVRAVVSLADLDPGSIDVSKSMNGESFWVPIHTIGKQKKVKYLFGREEGGFHTLGDKDELSIRVTDVAIAERIKKALQHAITICQERALKEAPAQPASKEAF